MMTTRITELAVRLLTTLLVMIAMTMWLMRQREIIILMRRKLPHQKGQ